MSALQRLNFARSPFVRRLAALLALLLLAAQTAGIAHRHADDALPAGHQAQVRDFCAGFQAAASAPEFGGPAHHAPPVLVRTQIAEPFRPPARRAAAHRSRAPPAFRSI